MLSKYSLNDSNCFPYITKLFVDLPRFVVQAFPPSPKTKAVMIALFPALK